MRLPYPPRETQYPPFPSVAFSWPIHYLDLSFFINKIKTKPLPISQVCAEDAMKLVMVGALSMPEQ